MWQQQHSQHRGLLVGSQRLRKRQSGSRSGEGSERLHIKEVSTMSIFDLQELPLSGRDDDQTVVPGNEAMVIPTERI